MRLLLIEDEPLIRAPLAAHLRKAGYALDEAASGGAGKLVWAGGVNGPKPLDPAFLKGQSTQAVGRAAGLVIASRRSGDEVVQVGRSLRDGERTLQRYTLAATLSGLVAA